MGIQLKDYIGDVETLFSKEEAKNLFEAAGYEPMIYKGKQLVFGRGMSPRRKFLGNIQNAAKRDMTEMYIFMNRECVWCGERFETKVLHDEHYPACFKENNLVPTKEQAWELIHNPNNY